MPLIVITSLLFGLEIRSIQKVASENDAKREGHREVSENFSLACERDQANQTILSMHRWNFD